MPSTKLVIGNKDGKSYTKVIEDNSILLGRKLGEQLKGEIVGLTGYEFKITGGSNDAGFPMRSEINLTGKKRIYSSGGVGVNPRFKGNLIRKTVVGNTIEERTAQLNLQVEKEGKKTLQEMFGKKETEEKQQTEKPEETKKEVKEQPKAEEKPKENKEPKKEQKEGGQTEDKN